MHIKWNDLIPIYVQIADAIEDDILSGILKPGDSCYSQVVIAKELGINPATAGKGIRILVDRGLLDKSRGQAMVVRDDAIELIKKRKREEIMIEMVASLTAEAKKLDMGQDELLELVKKSYSK